MIRGHVNSMGDAVISTVVKGLGGVRKEIRVVVDTGFSGFMTLPCDMISALDLPFRDTQEYTLADGSAVAFSAFDAIVDWDGGHRRIVVLQANGGPLIGMEMLRGFHLGVDVTVNGLVAIERLTAPA